jgi:hypothetical protein
MLEEDQASHSVQYNSPAAAEGCDLYVGCFGKADQERQVPGTGVAIVRLNEDQ